MTENAELNSSYFRHALRLLPVASRRAILESYPEFVLHLYRAAISASIFYCDKDCQVDGPLKTHIQRVPKKRMNDFTCELPSIMLDGIPANAKLERPNTPRLIWTEAGALSSVYRSLFAYLGEPTENNELVHGIEDELQFFGVGSELALDSVVKGRSVLELPLWPDRVDDSNALSVKAQGTEWQEMDIIRRSLFGVNGTKGSSMENHSTGSSNAGLR